MSVVKKSIATTDWQTKNLIGPLAQFCMRHAAAAGAFSLPDFLFADTRMVLHPGVSVNVRAAHPSLRICAAVRQVRSPGS